MTTTARILNRITTNDGTVDRNQLEELTEIADVVGENGKRETVALSAAFNALSPPTGAALVVLRWISGTGTWTLKGVTGDTGTALGTPTADTAPIQLPLGTTPSIGITASAVGSLEALWL